MYLMEEKDLNPYKGSKITVGWKTEKEILL